VILKDKIKDATEDSPLELIATFNPLEELKAKKLILIPLEEVNLELALLKDLTSLPSLTFKPSLENQDFILKPLSHLEDLSLFVLMLPHGKIILEEY